MWPFGRTKRSAADVALAQMEDAFEFARGRWLAFNVLVAFKEDVLLVDRIAAFQQPFEIGMRQAFPVIASAPGLTLMVAAVGIERSGTHSRAEIEDALGMPLPI